MFVRTKKGKILKCFKSESMNLPIYYVIGSKTNSYIEYQDVKKTSEDIIDILEVGDYVNGFPVIHKENDILKCGLLVQFKENEIKSILTKEQMEQMGYRIGD